MSQDPNFFDSEDNLKTEEQKKEEARLQSRLEDDVRWVLSSPKGQRVFWWIWSLCNTFGASYVQKDSTHTAFNEGKRDVGLRLMLLIGRINPKILSQIQDNILAEEGKKKGK